MKPLIRIAKRRLTSDRADARAGQIICFAAAVALFTLAVLKLCSLRLPEGPLIIGLLAALACALLLIVLGLLLPLVAGTQPRDQAERRNG